MKKGKEGAPLWKRALPGFVAGMVNGLFGGGGGLTCWCLCCGTCRILECHKAHATAIVTTACLSAVSLVVYLNRGVIDPSLALPLAAGENAVGSAAGAFWLNRVPTRLLAKGLALFSAVFGMEDVCGIASGWPCWAAAWGC